MSSAVKFVLASALLALTGGYLFMGALTQPPTEEPLPPPVASASASPSVGPTATPTAPVAPTATPSDPDEDLGTVALPAEIPAGLPSGRLRTALGPARWVHLSGDEDDLPPRFSPLVVPSGYVILDPGEGSLDPCEADEACRPPAIWRSTDLMSWSREALPVEAAGAFLVRSGGDYWLATFDPVTLWRSRDASVWVPIDLSQLRPAGPPGLDWELRLGVPAMSGGVVGVPIHYRAVDTASFLGLTLPDGVDALRAAESGLYHALGGNGEHLASLRFEEVSGGLRVIDDADGSVLAELDGVARESIERWAMSWSPFEPQVAILEEDRLVAVDLSGAPSGVERLSLFGTSSGFVAYRPEGDHGVRVWRSPDGRAWSDAGVLGDDDGEPPPDSLVHAGPELVRAVGPQGAWRSADGITWQEDRDRRFNEVELAGARLSLSKRSLSIRSEGQGKATRVDLGKLGLRMELPGRHSKGFGVAGQSTLVYETYNEQGRGQRNFWIITFDELPN